MPIKRAISELPIALAMPKLLPPVSFVSQSTTAIIEGIHHLEKRNQVRKTGFGRKKKIGVRRTKGSKGDSPRTVY